MARYRCKLCGKEFGNLDDALIHNQEHDFELIEEVDSDGQAGYQS